MKMQLQHLLPPLFSRSSLLRSTMKGCDPKIDLSTWIQFSCSLTAMSCFIPGWITLFLSAFDKQIEHCFMPAKGGNVQDSVWINHTLEAHESGADIHLETQPWYHHLSACRGVKAKLFSKLKELRCKIVCSHTRCFSSCKLWPWETQASQLILCLIPHIYEGLNHSRSLF